MSKLYVIGSINMDMIVQVSHFLQPGETLIGEEMRVLPGGKGANQAVALARLGTNPMMFGKIGKDQFGDRYREIFLSEGVEIRNIHIEEKANTGIAFIEVERKSAQNRILVVPGANARVDERYINTVLACINQEIDTHPDERHIVLFQLEIPLSPIITALTTLSQHKQVTTIVDPAPVPPELPPRDFYPHIDYITPNETETEYLTGVRVKDSGDARRAGNILLERGCSHVILKAGKAGAYYISGDDCVHVSLAEVVSAVDTTAAGDAFNAGFAYALGAGKGVMPAIHFANKVAGISTTKAGAQEAMPTLERVGG